jgi:hypothetical protein
VSIAVTPDGKLIWDGVKLCTTCCAACIDFSIEFPPFSGPWDPSITLPYPGCFIGPGWWRPETPEAGIVVYDKIFYNPLTVPADLVLTTEGYFDDDLWIDDTSWAMSHGVPCPVVITIPMGTKLVSAVAGAPYVGGFGGAVRLRITDTLRVLTNATGTACWVPSV